MSSYAVAHMRTVTVGPGIVEYLQRIDATLEPFSGQFLVHGAKVEVLEGTWLAIKRPELDPVAVGGEIGTQEADHAQRGDDPAVAAILPLAGTQVAAAERRDDRQRDRDDHKDTRAGCAKKPLKPPQPRTASPR